ncbi:autophagy-related protein 27 [Pilobolus umbonatus]|nr:autophagy-related protein 27 [Pilobolus umbonatus]
MHVVLSVQNYCNQGYKPIEDMPYQLDLSKLNNEFDMFYNKSTPPTTTSIITQINICDPLVIPEKGEKEDYCLPGAYVCRRTIHEKHSVEFIAQVDNIAGEFKDDHLNPEFSPVKPTEDPSKNGYQYSLILNGGKVNNIPQSAVITLECDDSKGRDTDADIPTFITFQNNVLTLQWKTVFACATKIDESKPGDSTPDKGKEEEPAKKGMSGLSIFFTTLFVVIGVYFVGGAFYNYKVYNAKGLDLIPHREFWLDFPYLVKDLIAHLMESIMPHRRGSGGYVSV